MNESNNTRTPETGITKADETREISTEKAEETPAGEARVISADDSGSNRLHLTRKQIAAIVILAVIAVVSFFGISSWASEEGNFTGTYQVLTDKQNAVLGMTAAAAGASTAITVIPGDVGTPVANELADLSSYFIFILCAVFLEKWLLTTFGMIAFKVIIPLALIAIIIGIMIANEGIKKIAIKLIIFALILFFIVPASVLVTKQVDESYKSSVEQSIEEINKDSEELNAASENKNLLEKIVGAVKGGATGIANKFKEKLQSFTEYVAYLIVTSCVIPVGVILLLVWIIKMLTGININLPKTRGRKTIKQ